MSSIMIKCTRQVGHHSRIVPISISPIVSIIAFFSFRCRLSLSFPFIEALNPEQHIADENTALADQSSALMRSHQTARSIRPTSTPLKAVSIFPPKYIS
ncbi:hypothetical protein M3J09_002115 [Ascochyta lentis]